MPPAHPGVRDGSRAGLRRGVPENLQGIPAEPEASGLAVEVERRAFWTTHPFTIGWGADCLKQPEITQFVAA